MPHHFCNISLPFPHPWENFTANFNKISLLPWIHYFYKSCQGEGVLHHANFALFSQMNIALLLLDGETFEKQGEKCITIYISHSHPNNMVNVCVVTCFSPLPSTLSGKEYVSIDIHLLKFSSAENAGFLWNLHYCLIYQYIAGNVSSYWVPSIYC